MKNCNSSPRPFVPIALSCLALSCGGQVLDSASSDTGGARASGGTRHGTGGRTSTGGTHSTGGTRSTGGTHSTGGALGTGGVLTTGGTAQTGGAVATGGYVTTGGVAATGGSTPTGGVTTTGGNTALGGAATGGTSANGGVPNAGAAGAAGRPPCGRLLDDMEDRSGRLCAGAGRQGVWYVFSDGFDEVWPAAERPGVPVLPVPIPERGSGSRNAMYLSVVAGDHSGWSTSTCWGSGIGFDLNYNGAEYGTYDAGAYSGFAFWARGTAGLVVEARASTIATTLTTYGGTCLEEFCDPYFYPVTLSAEWAYYQIQFSQLKHLGWQGSYDRGTVTYANVEFDVQQLTNIQFLAHKYGNCDTIPSQFEFWIDDVSFF